MYQKTISMERLRSMGLNRHNTLISKDPEEILSKAEEFQRFTIRTDCNQIRSELPFFMQKDALSVTGATRLEQFLKEGLENGFAFIIADGIKHDDIQLYNGVANLSVDGAFRLEVSTAKVPLRKMYEHPLFLLYGRLDYNVHLCDRFGTYQYPIRDLLKDMLKLYNLGIYNKFIEFTKYPIPVGERLDEYVYWEIR